MIGCGSIGQGLLPLLFSIFAIRSEQVTIITADEKGRPVAEQFGVRYLVEPVTPDNLSPLMSRHLQAGDLLLNLSVSVSSLALIALCKTREVLYLDTCIEPWGGGYLAHDICNLQTTNAWLRDQALALHTPGAPTAVIAHGMNPGLISHLLKEALLALARNRDVAIHVTPDWGALAQRLGVKVVHIVELDTQDDGQPLQPGEFANTWSAEGLYSEAWLQHAEIGWGSHERDFPVGASSLLSGRALCLAQQGANITVKSWMPALGEQQGLLITHHEVLSIAELLDTGEYRPSVCYVYTPCPKATASLANLQSGHPVAAFRVLACDALQGFDKIGVLLMHETGALWHGCTLSGDEARRLAPHNSATSLQVVAGIIGALSWMLDHPHQGVVEAESIDSLRVLAVARPYLGTISAIETDWRPGADLTFDEFLLTGTT
jgi:homospermidine synthase